MSDTMTEVRRIEDLLRRAYEGEAWHGPALREALEDVDAGRASARPLPKAHTIWELVLHVTTWEEAVRRWIEGDPWRPSPEEDWPPVSDTSPEAWATALARLESGNQALRAVIARVDETRLDEVPPGGRTPIYRLAHGAAQHDLYHAGQIALLKKGL